MFVSTPPRKYEQLLRNLDIKREEDQKAKIEADEKERLVTYKWMLQKTLLALLFQAILTGLSILSVHKWSVLAQVLTNPVWVVIAGAD